MATTKSTTLSKVLTSNIKCVKRVVSTSPKSHQLEQVMTVRDVAPVACPFRGAFQKIDAVLEKPIYVEQIDNNSTKSFEEVPGPKGLPIVGTLFDYFKKDGLRFNKMFEAFRLRSLEYGPIFKEKIGAISTVIISDPEAYNKVIHSETKYPKRREMEPMAYYRTKTGIGLGLVNAQGEEWHKHRTVVSKKMLKMKEVLDYCADMDKVGNDFISHLMSRRSQNDEIIGIEKELFKWAMESIGTFLFEERLGCLGKSTPAHTKAFIDNLQGFFKLMQPLMYNLPIYKIYPTKLWKQYESYADNVFQIGKSLIEKKANALQSRDTKEETDKVSFLTYLMSQQSLTSKEAVSTAVDLLVGATETTSTGSLWAFYCLAKNPSVQEKLYNEVKAVLPNNEPITPQKLTELPYVKAVLKETFRLYPITFATSRYIQNDLEVAGYNLPAGTHVQANLYGMFRNPELFPEPEAFKPERWLRENNMDSSLKALSNLVWGHGARMCIGRRFAEQEMHIMLTKVIQNFKLEYNHGTIEPVLNTVMTPDRPLHLSFVPRE